jgi:hypothetical protein
MYIVYRLGYNIDISFFIFRCNCCVMAHHYTSKLTSKEVHVKNGGKKDASKPFITEVGDTGPSETASVARPSASFYCCVASFRHHDSHLHNGFLKSTQHPSLDLPSVRPLIIAYRILTILTYGSVVREREACFLYPCSQSIVHKNI